MKQLKKLTALSVALSMSASLFVGQAAAAVYETEVTYGVNFRVDGNIYTTATRGVNFRSQPKVSNNKIGFISKGSVVQVLEEANAYWLKVKYNGKVGYADKSYFDYSGGAPKSAKSSGNATMKGGANFRAKPSPKGSKIGFIPKGASVQVLEKANAYWYKVKYNGKTGYVDSSFVNYDAPAPTAKAAEIIKTAKSYLGAFKYKWGAEPWNTNYKYADCSSFVQLVFNKKHGYDLPRTSKNQAKEGKYVKKSDLQPGDLVFFDTNGDGEINHVGIYLGAGEFIHSSPINEVGINNLNKGYWKEKYETARRVIK